MHANTSYVIQNYHPTNRVLTLEAALFGRNNLRVTGILNRQSSEYYIYRFAKNDFVLCTYSRPWVCSSGWVFAPSPFTLLINRSFASGVESFINQPPSESKIETVYLCRRMSPHLRLQTAGEGGGAGGVQRLMHGRSPQDHRPSHPYNSGTGHRWDSGRGGGKREGVLLSYIPAVLGPLALESLNKAVAFAQKVGSAHRTAWSGTVRSEIASVK